MLKSLFDARHPQFILLAVSLMIAACGGRRTSFVVNRSGNSATETVVRLVSIDDEGTELQQLDSTVTDQNGQFHFDLSSNTNASTIVVAELSDGALRSFFAGGSDGTVIHPITDALYSLVIDITTTKGGRSVIDFSSSELKKITNDVFNLEISDLSFSDSESLKDYLRTNVGRKIAAASGGQISSQSTLALEEQETSNTITFIQDFDVCSSGALFHLFLSSTFRFEIEQDGSICGGVHASLEPLLDEFLLTLPPNNNFYLTSNVYPGDSDSSGLLEGERELNLGAAFVQKSMTMEQDTISVNRKVYIPTQGDLARYLEIFSNSDSTDRTLDIEIKTNLTTGSNSSLLTHDLAPSSPSSKDRYVVAYDQFQDKPTAGFLIQDGLGSLSPTNLNVPGVAGGKAGEIKHSWTIPIPAGSTRTLLHYLFLSTSRSASELTEQMAALLENPDMTGMSLDELAGLLNFSPTRGTVNGEAGAVVGEATITVVNQRTSQSLTITARNDGSFAVPLDTSSGDELNITSSDGLDTTLIVP